MQYIGDKCTYRSRSFIYVVLSSTYLSLQWICNRVLAMVGWEVENLQEDGPLNTGGMRVCWFKYMVIVGESFHFHWTTVNHWMNFTENQSYRLNFSSSSHMNLYLTESGDSATESLCGKHNYTDELYISQNGFSARGGMYWTYNTHTHTHNPLH